MGKEEKQGDRSANTLTQCPNIYVKIKGQI